MSGDDIEGGRGRGRPARINRDRIVAAARGLPPQSLTMQAVVTDCFETRLAEVVLPREGAWQDVLRAYITAICDGIVQSGSVRTHYRLTGAPGSASLALARTVIEGGHAHAPGEHDFDLSVRIVIAGLERLLSRRCRAAAPGPVRSR